MNPYLKRLQQHSIGKAGRASEKRLAKDLQGRARPASGAMEGAKGDIDFPQVLMEAKSTTSLSLSIKHDWLLKIASEARSQGKTPALSISFVTGAGKAQPDGDWICVPKAIWDRYMKDGDP